MHSQSRGAPGKWPELRVSVSNLAWEREHDEAVSSLLGELGVDAIDVAPGRYFANPADVGRADALRVRDAWRARGQEIVGLQSLMFGTRGLNLFGDPDVQAAMLEHLEGVCRLSAHFGATRLVFGSPRNRDASGLSAPEALDRAVAFFRRLGDAAVDHGVTLCLEANPSAFGCNFMTTTSSAAEVVRAVDHAGIRLQLDTGTIVANDEDVHQLLREHAELVAHVHVSEPALAPVGGSDRDHSREGAAIRRTLPDRVATIEMLPGEPRVAALAWALRIVAQAYRERGGELR